jgi:hypothetical protein
VQSSRNVTNLKQKSTVWFYSEYKGPLRSYIPPTPEESNLLHWIAATFRPDYNAADRKKQHHSMPNKYNGVKEKVRQTLQQKEAVHASWVAT